MGTVGTHGDQRRLYPKIEYDPVKDFAPVALFAAAPTSLLVHPSFPARRRSHEFIAVAKKNPGKLNFASSGSGTRRHLSGELFKSDVGTEITHVPYKGSAPALIDLVGGQSSLMFDPSQSVLQTSSRERTAARSPYPAPALRGAAGGADASRKRACRLRDERLVGHGGAGENAP